MNPNERIKRYAQLIALGAVLFWGALCYLLLLSPKFTRVEHLQQDTIASNKQLAEYRREIEDAAIAGPPVEGASRFEKFGILGIDEEQLFLSDLIDFCAETHNTLDLVRRSGVARTVSAGAEQTQQGGQQARRGTSASSAPEAPRPVIMRVPHTVSYSGSFLSSFYLLRRLESYRRLLTVERMEIGTDHQVGYPRVKGTITIDLYLVKSPGGTSTTQQASTTAKAETASG